MGATASDQSVLAPFTIELSEAEAGKLYEKAMKGTASAEDARLFAGSMLMESARMSIDDGLTMMLHSGICRSHNQSILEAFGRDRGGDIPVPADYINNLRPFLNKYGNDPNFIFIIFTLDETTYTRELAPLAGHYPAMKLGPAWWFHDSREGMLRYRRMVTETAGIYNTVGFNDDTRAFRQFPLATIWLGVSIRGFWPNSSLNT